jgi:hypothetical protein
LLNARSTGKFRQMSEIAVLDLGALNNEIHDVSRKGALIAGWRQRSERLRLRTSCQAD